MVTLLGEHFKYFKAIRSEYRKMRMKQECTGDTVTQPSLCSWRKGGCSSLTVNF